MSTTESQLDPVVIGNYPGQHLAIAREAKGYSQEYVAGKLHLRVRVIELLESDRYDELPQPVFVQGYFRAYAKLLEVEVEPLLAQYAELKTPEHRAEKVLRQRHREPQYWDVMLRWISGLAVLLLLMGAFVWWNRSSEMNVASAVKPESKQSTQIGLEPAVTTPTFSTLRDLSTLDTNNLSLKSELPLVESHDG